MALERMAAGAGRKRRRPRRSMAATGPTRAIIYCRVSTVEQGQDGGSLDGQRSTLERECEARGWQVVAWREDQASGKDLDRPGISDVLAMLAAGEASVLVVAKLDRLTRSVQDFGSLVTMAQDQGWGLRILDLGLDMTTPQGELMANVLASFAQFERRLIAARTREGIAALKAAGRYRGVKLPPEVRDRIAAMRASGITYSAMAARLNAEGVPSARGGRWHASAVHGAINGYRSTDEPSQDETPPPVEWATHDGSGRALSVPGPDGTQYRNGKPVDESGG